MAGAIEVTKLLVPLLADIKDFEKKMGRAQGIADSFAKNLQSVGKIALGGLGVLATGAAAVGGALTKLAIDAAPLAGVQSAFDGLAESAGVGGAAMLEALQEGSAGMITNRDLMMSFNKAAQLVSKDFATQLPDAMQYLGKVSAATGQDMGFMMDSLVTGVGRLSPMILDNLGIQVSLSEATARAAKMFGVEEAALTKTQQQAGMMNVVLEKLEANTAAMPDTAGSAAAGLAQFTTMLQNTKDTIGLAFVPTLNTMLGIFTDLATRILPPLIEFLEGRLAPAFEKIAKVISDFIWMLDVGVAPADALKMALEQLFGPEVAERVMGIVTGIQEFIAVAQEALAPVIAWVSENVGLQDVLIALAVAIGFVVAAVVGPLLVTMGQAIAVFAVVMAVVAALRVAWETNFLGIRDIAAAVWGWLQEFIPAALGTIQEVFTTVVTAIQEFWAVHGDNITTKAQEIWDKVVAIFEFFKGQFTTLFGAFKSLFEGDFNAFGEQLRVYWDTAWAAIKKIGEDTWAAILKFFGDTDWGKIGKDVLDGIAKGIKAGTSFLTGAIKGVIKAALAAVSGFFGGSGAGGGVTGGYPGVPPPNAAGTKNWRGGLTWVGEEGPELVNIPRGAQIMSAPASMALLANAFGGKGGTTEIHHHYPVTVNTRATTGTYLQDLALAQSQV